MTETRNIFVVLEGLDGTGKTTVASALKVAMKESGRPTVCVRTPLPPYDQIASKVIALGTVESRFAFFLASIFDASERIRKQLSDTSVVCDRYVYSTLAYHLALGVDRRFVEAVPRVLQPDFKFLLTVDEKTRRRRITERGKMTAGDRSSRDDVALVDRIRDEYARFEFSAIDTGEGNPEEVAKSILSCVVGSAVS